MLTSLAGVPGGSQIGWRGGSVSLCKEESYDSGAGGRITPALIRVSKVGSRATRLGSWLSPFPRRVRSAGRMLPTVQAGGRQRANAGEESGNLVTREHIAATVLRDPELRFKLALSGKKLPFRGVEMLPGRQKCLRER